MAQTVKELVELLENIQTTAETNAESMNKILTSINTHLEDIQNDTESDDLIKVYLNEYKKALEDRHSFVSKEFSKINDSINNLAKNQDALSKSSDIDKLFTTLLENLHSIQNNFYEQTNSFNKFNTSFIDFTNNKNDKEEIISTINAARQEKEISDSNFEKSIVQISNNTENILKNLIIMDPTAQNDIIKKELENIYASSSAILTSIHETEQKSDNLIELFNEVSTKDDISELQNSINKFSGIIENLKATLSTSNDDINILIKDKLDNFSNILDKVVSENDFSTFRHELANFIQQIVDNSAALNQGLSIQKDILENLIDKINTFDITKNLDALAETLTQQTDKLGNYINEITEQIKNSNNDEQFDSIKSKVENSSFLINENINLLKDTITSSLNDNSLSEKLLAIRNIIVEKSDLNDENLRDLQEKIEEFITVGNRISSEAEIKMGNSVSELADLKNEIEDISSSFRNWNYNREEHDSKMVGMISAELDNLKESVSTFQESVQAGIHQELTKNNETIEKQLNNIIGYVNTLKDEINTNHNDSGNEETSKEEIQDISDKINSIRQEINLINTDIMDTVTTSAEALMAEVSPLKSALDAIVEIKDSIKAEYETLNDTSRNERLFAAIDEIKNFINEKMQISQQNNDELKNIISVAMNNDELKWSIDEFKNTVGARISEGSNSINEMLDTLNQKIDLISSSEDSELKYNIEEIKNMISSHKELLDESNMKESIIETIVNVFDQISFIEESEDIKDFVEEKTDEINQNILEVKKQLTQFVNGEDEYSYTLQDVESDIAKLRMVLNDLSNTSSQEEISDISNNIHRIVTTVEELQTSLTQEQISDLKNNFEKLSEDVVSISSRTNKLLLTSDESYNALNNGLNDFSNVISQLEERINYLDNKEITERIEEKLDSTYNVVTSSANSDKVMRQALMYMGEWIDTTSENIESLCENTDAQRGKSEEIISTLEEIKETLPEQKQLLSTITVHFDEQQERMDRLEMKLEKILAAIDNIDDTKLVNKVDKIDKQVKKLSTTIEKLATYVDE